MTTSRVASILIRPSGYIIQPEWRTTTGLWIAAEPIRLLAIDASSTTLGEVVQHALASSKDGVEHPTDWRALLSPLLQCAGVRSWNALQRSAKSVHVEATDKIIRVIPSMNGGTVGAGKGYHELTDKVITLAPSCSDKEIGDAVILAVELCC